jgi:NAD(P)-dependent dehydrogenase (short-subunit alcohol dehydrogenase family)
MQGLFDIKGKCAVVTGGSRGIGEMIAAGFVANGVRTYISSRKAEACRATARRLSRDGGECIAVPADLSGLDGIRELAADLSAREPVLHVLVNNAGAAWGEALDAFPESGWDKVMDINVKGPFFLIQALLPLLEAAASAEDPARIINIGSIDGLKVSRLPTFSYGPSKAAIHHLTRMLAVSLADRSITCNAIAPGPFPSKMMEHTLETMGEEIRAAVPLKRIGKASDIAGTAIFLASAAGAYVNGAVIPLDGGTVAAGRSL